MEPERAVKQGFVQIEIDVSKLESLFSQGQLCVADFRCLNDETKKYVWELCLASCSRRMQCHTLSSQCCSECEPVKSAYKPVSTGSVKPIQILKIT